jgi:hypothetical protein
VRLRRPVRLLRAPRAPARAAPRERLRAFTARALRGRCAAPPRISCRHSPPAASCPARWARPSPSPSPYPSRSQRVRGSESESGCLLARSTRRLRVPPCGREHGLAPRVRPVSPRAAECGRQAASPTGSACCLGSGPSPCFCCYAAAMLLYSNIAAWGLGPLQTGAAAPAATHRAAGCEAGLGGHGRRMVGVTWRARRRRQATADRRLARCARHKQKNSGRFRLLPGIEPSPSKRKVIIRSAF